MSIEVILTGAGLLLVGGWIVAQLFAGDPIENWKRGQKDHPEQDDTTDL
ncbi:MAG: hypothetical protein M3132_15170 [Actinomycetia bacterium]|nr:hypothetical protein [Actinomycetes bacterium]